MVSDIDKAKIRRLDGGLLLVLKELLEHGSVTRTAESLSLSQSTISHALSRLRDLFEDPLFIRRPHGLEATQRALELQPQIETLLDLTGQALGIGQSFEPANAKRLFSISAPEFVSVVAATSVLNRIAQSAPSVGLYFQHLSEAEVFERLRRGELDVAIGRFDETPAEIELELLYQDEFCVAMRHDHPAARGRLSEAKYATLEHIWAHSDSETTPKDARFDISSYRGSIVPKWLSALNIAARSDYVATCPRSLALHQKALLNLSLKKMPFSADPIRISLACRAEQRDKGTQWLIEQIRQTF